MVKPSSGTSTVLQLNMGEGKSSLIIPMVAASLADSQNLVRVVVLRSLSNQMFQTLVSRLTGLSNRRIFYLPFSRQTPMTQENIDLIRRLLDECAHTRGILIAQPEHILSFKLKRMDMILKEPSQSSQLVVSMQEIYDWLAVHSRDILDESDEILHVRYQLIYTSGQQQSLEDSPGRWITIQNVVGRIKTHAMSLRNRFEHDVHIVWVPNSYPLLRITSTEAFRACTGLLALDALDGRIDNINLPALSGDPNIRSATLRFITDLQIPDADYDLVRSRCERSQSWKSLLLLRGLLAHGILAHVFDLRWRIDYGLDIIRSLMAVPYRAKVRLKLQYE